MRCRVTRRGADKISTGRHEPMLGDETYAEGEVISGGARSRLPKLK